MPGKKKLVILFSSIMAGLLVAGLCLWLLYRDPNWGFARQVSPEERDKRMLLDYQSSRLTHGLERSLSGQRQRLSGLAAALDAMSPLKVLGRGYAIARKEDGHVIASVNDAGAGERFELRLSDGSLCCEVKE